MTCLPKVFPVFLLFSFSSCRLYKVQALFIVSSLALPNLSYVHLCPSKCALPLSITLFKHSRFRCCLMPSLGLSTRSPKKSSSFNMLLALSIIFIKCLNCHHMRNNIRYKGNINNTSVIFYFFNWGLTQQNLPAMFLCLGEPPARFL